VGSSSRSSSDAHKRGSPQSLGRGTKKRRVTWGNTPDKYRGKRVHGDRSDDDDDDDDGEEEDDDDDDDDEEDTYAQTSSDNDGTSVELEGNSDMSEDESDASDAGSDSTANATATGSKQKKRRVSMSAAAKKREKKKKKKEQKKREEIIKAQMIKEILKAEKAVSMRVSKKKEKAKITPTANKLKQVRKKKAEASANLGNVGLGLKMKSGPEVEVKRGQVSFDWEYQIDNQGFLQSNDDTEALIAGIVRNVEDYENSKAGAVDCHVTEPTRCESSAADEKGELPAVPVQYRNLILNGSEVARLHRRKRRLKYETSIHAGTPLLTKVSPVDSITQVVDGFIAVDDGQDRKSLGLLARSCLDALERLGPISMTRLTTELRMVKRRIYDVSNILEGVGVIEKGQRNMVRLTKCGKLWAWY
jgi:hypothetical protein